MSEQTSPSFVGRRQQHIHFRVQTKLDFTPQSENEWAGLTLAQNNDFHFLFILTKETEPIVRLIKRAHGAEEVLAEQPAHPGKVYLRVEAHEQDYHFYFANQSEEWRSIAEHVDGRILSTPVAGGFVGAYIGMYASSNGEASTNYADFDWFEYVGLDE